MKAIKYTLNIFINDIIKIFTRKEIYLAILATFIILGLTNVYTSQTGEQMNSFNIFLEDDYEYILNSNVEILGRQTIVQHVFGKLWMFAPLICMMPLINVLVNEKRKGAIRIQIFRTGKNAYIIGKFLVAFIVGGMVTVLGFLMYVAYAYALFPDASEHIKMLEEMGIPGFNFWLTLGEYFIIGAFAATIGYLFSSFITNIYLVMCLPFILNYLIYMFSNNYVYYSGKNGTVLYRIIYALRSESMMLLHYGDKIQNMFVVGYVAIMAIIAIVVWKLIFVKKIDSGV